MPGLVKKLLVVSKFLKLCENSNWIPEPIFAQCALMEEWKCLPLVVYYTYSETEV